MLRVDPRWRPSEKNERAVDLTNEPFGNFEELPLDLLNKLWATKDQFGVLHLQSKPAGLPAVAKAT